jgi:hypothetical protein
MAILNILIAVGAVSLVALVMVVGHRAAGGRFEQPEIAEAEAAPFELERAA